MTAPQHGHASPESAPPNNLVWAIVAAVLCLPVGVVAILKSVQVDKLWAQGQREAARRAAAESQTYVKWAGIVCVLWLVIIVLFQLIIGIGGSAN